MLGNLSVEYQLKPLLSSKGQKELSNKEAILKCEKSIHEATNNKETVIFSCRLKCQKKEDKTIQKVIFCITSVSVYIFRYNFQFEEVLNCYSYPINTITSLIRDKVFDSSKFFFSKKKDYDSLKLINKFVYSGGDVHLESDKIVEQFFKVHNNKKSSSNPNSSEEYNFGQFYPSAPTPIDEDGLMSAFDNTETSFTKNLNEKETAFIWPTLFSKNSKVIENCVQVILELNKKIIILSNY